MNQTTPKVSIQFTTELTFGFGNQTTPCNWQQTHDYSFYSANPSGHGIVPTTETGDDK